MLCPNRDTCAKPIANALRTCQRGQREKLGNSPWGRHSCLCQPVGWAPPTIRQACHSVGSAHPTCFRHRECEARRIMHHLRRILHHPRGEIQTISPRRLSLIGEPPKTCARRAGAKFVEFRTTTKKKKISWVQKSTNVGQTFLSADDGRQECLPHGSPTWSVDTVRRQARAPPSQRAPWNPAQARGAWPQSGWR